MAKYPLGDQADAKATDPDEDDENQTVIALLKGILAELQAQTAILTDIETNTGTP